MSPRSPVSEVLVAHPKQRKRRGYAGPAPTITTSEVDAYYDAGRGCYWVKNSRGGWVCVNETSLRRFLRSAGLSAHCGESDLVSPLDKELIELQTERDVDYAGPLAGRKIGLYEMQGRRILVTESPVLIEPKDGDWPLLNTVLDGMLNDPIRDQRPYLFGWLKVALESLYKSQRRPGQALAIAGQHDCGKSLLQNLLTVLLGGRMAKPYQYMTGGSQFNADLFAAEHLMIEDEAANYDIRARRNFGAHLKNITVNDAQRCHAKNRTPVSLTPFWRLTITVNDEPENLMVLPPIDDSIEDKIILLHASKRPMPKPTNTDAERNSFWNELLAELPAFAQFVMQWEIPDALSSQRFGVTYYHHPQLLSAIDALSPEQRLLSFIDAELFDGTVASDPWSGSAESLERRLTSKDSEFSYQARQLFSFNTACGVYLARLAKKLPDRFTKRRSEEGREWVISPPSGLSGCQGSSSFSDEEKKVIEGNAPAGQNDETARHPVSSPIGTKSLLHHEPEPQPDPYAKTLEI